MYGLAEYEAQRQRPEEIRREVAAIRLEKAARKDRRTRPYVVRDLSWELARFLDAEDLPPVAFDAPDGANGNTLEPE